MDVCLKTFLLLLIRSSNCVQINTFKKFLAPPLNWDGMTKTESQMATIGQCFSLCDEQPSCKVMAYRGKICTIVTKIPVTISVLMKKDTSPSREPIFLSQNLFEKGVCIFLTRIVIATCQHWNFNALFVLTKNPWRLPHLMRVVPSSFTSSVNLITSLIFHTRSDYSLWAKSRIPAWWIYHNFGSTSRSASHPALAHK